MARRLLSLMLVAILVGAGSAVSEEIYYLWFDDENTYLCDDPFVESGLDAWLAETTDDDCSGAGFCDFGWSEGVIYMHPVRLVVDLSTVGAVDSVEVWSWVTEPDNLRVFLYQGDTIIEQVASDWYDGDLTLYGNGQEYDYLVISACDAEFYEAYLYASEAVDVEDQVPGSRSDLAAYPNPFNPKTTLSYSLPEDCRVSLSIHDLAGRKKIDLVSGEMREGGEHFEVWNGRDARGRLLASGAYIARLVTPYGSESRRLLLVK